MIFFFLLLSFSLPSFHQQEPSFFSYFFGSKKEISSPLLDPVIQEKKRLLARIQSDSRVNRLKIDLIRMIMEKVVKTDPSILTKITLDIGSGLGGTSRAFFNEGCLSLWGLEMDSQLAEEANKLYPSINFIEGNILNKNLPFQPYTFSFAYAFQTLSEIPNKRLAIKNASLLMKPGALLTIADYSASCEKFDTLNPLGYLFYPISVRAFKEDLLLSGFELLEIVDVSSLYIKWHKDILVQLRTHEKELLVDFSQEELDSLSLFFEQMVNSMEKNDLGAVLFYAKKVRPVPFFSDP